MYRIFETSTSFERSIEQCSGSFQNRKLHTRKLENGPQQECSRSFRINRFKAVISEPLETAAQCEDREPSTMGKHFLISWKINTSVKNSRTFYEKTFQYKVRWRVTLRNPEYFSKKVLELSSAKKIDCGTFESVSQYKVREPFRLKNSSISFRQNVLKPSTANHLRTFNSTAFAKFPCTKHDVLLHWKIQTYPNKIF